MSSADFSIPTYLIAQARPEFIFRSSGIDPPPGIDIIAFSLLDKACTEVIVVGGPTANDPETIRQNELFAEFLRSQGVRFKIRQVIQVINTTTENINDALEAIRIRLKCGPHIDILSSYTGFLDPTGRINLFIEVPQLEVQRALYYINIPFIQGGICLPPQQGCSTLNTNLPRRDQVNPDCKQRCH